MYDVVGNKGVTDATWVLGMVLMGKYRMTFIPEDTVWKKATSHKKKKKKDKLERKRKRKEEKKATKKVFTLDRVRAPRLLHVHG